MMLELAEAVREARGLESMPVPAPAAPSPPTDVQRLRRLLAVRARRQREALRLAVPLPAAEPFHASGYKVRLIDGSNQSSKTFHAALEVARALCGCDPYGKYPKTNGKAGFVGLDGDHLADPMYSKLFKEGEFSLIQDERTKKWRSVRPDRQNPKQLDPYDEAYREKWKPAPPLVPPRLVKSHAWEDRAKEVPRVTQMKNGWRVLWRSSGGSPFQGVQMDLIWADEEILHSEKWIPEMLPRLIKRGGRFIWSATPQDGGIQLAALRDEADGGSPHVAAFSLFIVDNPYLSEEEKAAFKALLFRDEDVRVRYFGEYSISARYVYEPKFHIMEDQGCEPFVIPPEYTRYMSVDPGRQRPGTIFAAVDPDEKHAYVYGGFALRNSDAGQWANRVKTFQENTKFEAFIFDKCAGKQHGMGATITVARQYWEALQERGITPRVRGPLEGFMPGSDDVPAREEALLDWMTLRQQGPFRGTCKLQVFRGRLPELEREIRWAQYKRDRPDKRMELEEDLLDTLEYLAAYGPIYHPPEPVVDDAPTGVYKAFLAKEARRQERRGVAGGIVLH